MKNELKGLKCRENRKNYERKRKNGAQVSKFRVVYSKKKNEVLMCKSLGVREVKNNVVISNDLSNRRIKDLP